MVHIANCGKGAQGPLFFNVDVAVGTGPGATPDSHSHEDTLLVQFLLKGLGYYDFENNVGARYSGRNDRNTQEAIRVFQRAHAPAWIDGRISPAVGVTFAPNAPFSIVVLNRLFRERYLETWPMLSRTFSVPMPAELNRKINLLLGYAS